MFYSPSETAITWGLAVLATALGGGLLLLHGFAKSKGVSERMLDAYDDLLSRSREMDEENNEDGDEMSDDKN